MVTETFTAGEDFFITGGVFNLVLTLEGEAGSGSIGGSGGVVEGEIDFIGESLFIRESEGGASGDNPGGNSIDVRRGGTTLQDRIAVAAAGGGAGVFDDGSAQAAGGDGAPDTGADGATGSSGAEGGFGGTQSAGGAGGDDTDGNPDGQDGALGDGGDGGDGGDTFTQDGGGGGAGYYGGGGGGSEFVDQASSGGGGGGSNYDDGLDTVTTNARGTSPRTFGQGGLVTAEYNLQEAAQNFQVVGQTDTTITLDWDAPTLLPEVDSIDQYRIYRDTDPGTDRADYTEVGTTPTPGFDDTGLDNGTEYHYRVGADLFVPEAEGTITITDFRGV